MSTLANKLWRLKACRLPSHDPGYQHELQITYPSGVKLTIIRMLDDDELERTVDRMLEQRERRLEFWRKKKAAKKAKALEKA